MERALGENLVPDLARLVNRLARRLSKDDAVRIAAVDFLKRKDLLGSVLRTDAAEGSDE